MIRRLGDLCLWAATVDRERLAAFPQDRARYVTIGGAVFTVASMALLSAIAFARVVLHFGLPGALAFGVWWGAVILNVERLIQAAIHRESSWQRTLLLALPRIALAVIFGMVIALPLELKAFAPEIRAQARLDKNEADHEAHLALDEQFAEIPKLQAQAHALQGAITKVSTGDILFTNTAYQTIARRYGRLNAQAQAAPTEALRRHYERRAAVARDRLVPLRAELLAQERDATRADRRAKQTELDAVNARLQRLVEAKQVKEDALRQAFEAEAGLSDQVQALDELTDAKPAVSSVSLLLWLVVFSIDVVAAVMRMLMSLGEPCDFERSELARSTTNRDLAEEIEAIFRAQELELAHERARLHAEVERRQMQREIDLQRRMDAEFADAVEENVLSHARRWGRRHAEDYIRETDAA